MTIAEKINGERAVVLGWGRAILLQLAHPLVAAGVAEHSRLASHRIARLGRLHSTVRAMRRLTFGDEHAVLRTAASINAIHDRVNGTLRLASGLFPEGTRYSATDPALLAWVHATLLDSLPLAYEQFVGPLTETEKDSFCAESAPAARLLRIPEDIIIFSRAQLDRYMRGMLSSPQIAVASTARQLASDLLYPPLTDATRPAAWLMRLVTLGLLPATIREAYGFPWRSGDERRFERLSAALRRLRKHVPASLARWSG
ncbi:MAG: oxygenase MpaB family protein [Vicinamibacterales bacterium]